MEDFDEEKWRPTPEALLFSVLEDWGITSTWNYKIYHGVYEDFMRELEKHRYARWVEE